MKLPILRLVLIFFLTWLLVRGVLPSFKVCLGVFGAEALPPLPLLSLVGPLRGFFRGGTLPLARLRDRFEDNEVFLIMETSYTYAMGTCLECIVEMACPADYRHVAHFFVLVTQKMNSKGRVCNPSLC